MAKYHITIDSLHWQRTYPQWDKAQTAERGRLIRSAVDRIQAFLEEVPQLDTVQLLVTDETVTIDPLDGDVRVDPIH